MAMRAEGHGSETGPVRRQGAGSRLCRSLGGTAAAFLLAAALLAGGTAVRAMLYNAARISLDGISWRAGLLLRESILLLPALLLLSGAVFAVLLTVTGRTRWWTGSVCALLAAAAAYALIPPQALMVTVYAELRFFFGMNLLPFYSKIPLLPFQAAECAAGAALAAAGISLLWRRRTGKKRGNLPESV